MPLRSPSPFARRTLLCALAFMATALFPNLVAAQLPTRGVLPPAYCGTAMCARGLNLYALGKYDQAARTFERAAKQLPAGEAAWRSRVDLMVLAAHAWEVGEAHDRAGLGYLRASRVADGLRSYLQFKAAQNLLLTPKPPLDVLRRIAAHGVFQRGYPGSALVAARLDALVRGGLPAVGRARAALAGEDRQSACQWLSAQLVAAPKPSPKIAELTYGYCLPDDVVDGFDKLHVEPSAQIHLERAERWYAAVRFQEAFDELKKVDLAKLDATDRCRAQFRYGRTLYRLHKRDDSIAHYEKVIAKCKNPTNADDRVSAMYAVGKMLFWRDKFDASRKHFQKLLHDYPKRSHADDALLYLARIARKADKTDAEKMIVTKALTHYPDGDMVHEIVWEYVEGPYRAGHYKQFLARLHALKLPPFDNQYFSQGRLAYFSGRAWKALGDTKKAYDAWQKAWTTYPFSFYGYLSRERLVQHGQTPASLDAGSAAGVSKWFVDARWSRSAPARLVRLGLFGMAADLEHALLSQAHPSDADRWRLSYLEDMAGRYPVSHNIARRTIAGRPWAAPALGRLLRWRIAWPNPFAGDIRRAVIAERRQANDGQDVQPALPAAIMREESSFVEGIESWAGALGLMQLMPATARAHDDDIDGEATPDKLKTAKVNIRVGVDLLFALARRFDSQPVLMTAAYNAGGGAVSSWIRHKKTGEIGLWVEDIPYDQTRNYTKRVIGSYAAYQWLSGIRDLDPTVARDL